MDIDIMNTIELKQFWLEFSMGVTFIVTVVSCIICFFRQHSRTFAVYSTMAILAFLHVIAGIILRFAVGLTGSMKNSSVEVGWLFVIAGWIYALVIVAMFWRTFRRTPLTREEELFENQSAGRRMARSGMTNDMEMHEVNIGDPNDPNRMLSLSLQVGVRRPNAVQQDIPASTSSTREPLHQEEERPYGAGGLEDSSRPIVPDATFDDSEQPPRRTPVRRSGESRSRQASPRSREPLIFDSRPLADDRQFRGNSDEPLGATPTSAKASSPSLRRTDDDGSRRSSENLDPRSLRPRTMLGLGGSPLNRPLWPRTQLGPERSDAPQGSLTPESDARDSSEVQRQDSSEAEVNPFANPASSNATLLGVGDSNSSEMPQSSSGRFREPVVLTLSTESREEPQESVASGSAESGARPLVAPPLPASPPPTPSGLPAVTSELSDDSVIIDPDTQMPSFRMKQSSPDLAADQASTGAESNVSVVQVRPGADSAAAETPQGSTSSAQSEHGSRSITPGPFRSVRRKADEEGDATGIIDDARLGELSGSVAKEGDDEPDEKTAIREPEARKPEAQSEPTDLPSLPGT